MQLARYIAVGLSAYGLEMACLYALHNTIGLNATLSVAVSFWVGFFGAFIMQKIFTFKQVGQPKHIVIKQLARYSLLVLFNYVFSLLVVQMLHDQLNVLIIRTMTIAVIVGWNYIIYNKFIFNAPPNAKKDS